jgi:hypothetical protein
MSQPKRQPRQVQVRRGANLFDRPPKISVIVTAGDSQGDASATLDSALKQKFREHEVIVAVGRSGASTNLSRAASARIEDIVLVKQRGGTEASARSAALDHARGEIVAFLSSGDTWNADFLAAQLIHLERGGFDLVYCDAALTGTKTAYRRSFIDEHPGAGAANFANLLAGECPILVSSVLVRRARLEAVTTDDVPEGADAERLMWLELAGGGSAFGCNTKQLLRYRERIATDDAADARPADERALLSKLLESTSLAGEERALVESTLARLESRMAEERGISLLRSGENEEAINCLRDAARYQPTFKLTAVTWLARVAPKAALYLADARHVPPAPPPEQYRG